MVHLTDLVSLREALLDLTDVTRLNFFELVARAAFFSEARGTK